MTLTYRPYAGLADLAQMKAIVTAGRRAHRFSGIHRGDLDWWIFYDPSGALPEQKIRLWSRDGHDIAWTIANLEDDDFDMALLPDYRGSAEEAYIIDTMIAWTTEVALRKPVRINPSTGETIPPTITTYANLDETTRIARIEGHGLVGEDHIVNLAQDIRGPLPEPVLPKGFYFLERMVEDHAALRAEVHFDAFRPTSRMTPAYYRSFMLHAPDYDPTLDIVTVAPDGRFAAFAMAWIDDALKMSEFEPVGTRYEFHRRGLGRATLLEGLRRLKARGVETALVSTGAEEDGNIAFYRACGFEIVNTVRAYEKEVG